MSKKSLAEKEKELVLKIEKAKKELANLHRKQKQEIGDLACKHNLHEFDSDILDKAFADLYQKLNKDNQNVAA